MNRLRIAVLLTWTVGLSALLAAGRYSLFIRGSLWPLLLGTVVMFVLFLLTTLAGRRGPGRPASAAVWARSSLLLLPLAYMFPLMSASAASGLNSFALHKRSLGLETGPNSNVGGGDAAPRSSTPAWRPRPTRRSRLARWPSGSAAWPASGSSPKGGSSATTRCPRGRSGSTGS